MRNILCFFLACFFSGCHDNTARREVIKVSPQWIDSLKKASDTSWSKKYRNPDFIKADYFLTKKDSIVTQLMRDAFDNIRQILVAKNGKTRLLFQQYYSNGQLMAKLPVDEQGRFSGESIYYHENGRVKYKGSYRHGFYAGQWTSFDKDGKYLSTDKYDKNGGLITIKK